MSKAFKIIGGSFFLLGVILLSVNIYGLFQNIRPETFPNQDLRFSNDTPIPYKTALEEIQKKESESENEYLDRLSRVIAKSIAHIDWNQLESSAYNMHVPVWENYILFGMGLFSGIPEFEKYHFASHLRSLKRGVGVCGDASMVMSQILDIHGIPNQMLTFPGHVVVAVQNEQDEKVFDPDFGVALPFAPEDLKYHPQAVGNIYMNAGYTENDARIINSIYEENFTRWNGVKHFITKRYYFEKIAYALKWLIPFLSIGFGIILSRNKFTKI